MGLGRDAALRGTPCAPSAPARAGEGAIDVKKPVLKKGAEKISPLSSYLLKQSGLGASSFKKAQETLHYVSKEIEWQGLGHLSGLASSLHNCETGGKHPQNIKRDMLRKLAAKNPDSPVPIEHVLVPLYELEPDGSYSIQQRPMPLILPEKLFPWMMRRGIFPNLAEGSVQQYWTHLKSIGSPLGGMSDDGCHIPLYLWGDGAQYTESGQSIMAFTCGIVIDKNRSNTWPLFLCREEMSTGCDTIWALLEPVVESLQKIYDGLPLPASSAARTRSDVKMVVTELRGDWKYLVEILHLNRWYRCNFICHRCHAHKDTFMVSPARLLDKQRCSAEEFFRVSVKPGKQCPLFSLPYWIPQCIRFDSMHVLCLGVDLLVAGNVMTQLVGCEGLWEGHDTDAKLLCAWQRFKTWAKENKWQHSVPKFCQRKLRSNQHPYPELQSKAWNARVVIAWLAFETRRVQAAGAGEDALLLQNMSRCVNELHRWHSMGEANGLYLSKLQAERMARCCDRSMAAYIELAERSLTVEELGWPSRPKFHAWQEICQAQIDDLINHRFAAGWHVEDFVGRLVTSLCTTQSNGVERGGLQAWYTGLCAAGSLQTFNETSPCQLSFRARWRARRWREHVVSM